MITSVKLKNYRSFEDATLDLGRITVLVGQNAAGKSNLIDALMFVRDALQLGLDIAVSKRGGVKSLRRWSAKGRPYDVGIELHFEIDRVAGNYRFTLGSARLGEYQVKEEACEFETPSSGFAIRNGEWINWPDNLMQVRGQSQALTLPLLNGIHPFDDLYGFLTGMSFYTIMPDILGEPQKPANPYPLEENAENLASLLRELKTSYTSHAAALEKTIQKIIGDIEGYQVRQVGGYLVTRLRHSNVEEDRSPLFELFQESDGTLRLLGILTALYQLPSRPFISIEEPELTIHPGAMALLWEEIYRASAHSQILLTTHSPDLLELCDAEQLRVVEKIDGISHVGPVEEEQRQIIQKDLLSAGQLMRGQGLYRAEEAKLGAQ